MHRRSTSALKEAKDLQPILKEKIEENKASIEVPNVLQYKNDQLNNSEAVVTPQTLKQSPKNSVSTIN